MPQSVNDLASDPDFKAMAPHDQRVVVGAYLDADADFKGMAPHDQDVVRNRYYASFPDPIVPPLQHSQGNFDPAASSAISDANQQIAGANANGKPGPTLKPTPLVGSTVAIPKPSPTIGQVQQTVATQAAQPAYVKANADRIARTNAFINPGPPAFEKQVQQYMQTKFTPGDQTLGNQVVARIANLPPQFRLEQLDPALSPVYKAAILRQAAIVAKDPNRGLLQAVPQPQPNALQRGVAAVGSVLSAPAAGVKALVQPIEQKLMENAPGVETRTPRDVAEMKRVAALPFIQRAKALQNQSITRMAEPDRAAQEAARYQKMGQAERLRINLTNMAVNMATDPVAYLPAAGILKGGNVAKAVSAAFGASMLAPYAANPAQAIKDIQADPAGHLPQILMGVGALGHATGTTAAITDAIKNQSAFSKPGEVPAEAASVQPTPAQQAADALGAKSKVAQQAPQTPAPAPPATESTATPAQTSAFPTEDTSILTARPGAILTTPHGETIQIVKNDTGSLTGRMVVKVDGKTASVDKQAAAAAMAHPTATEMETKGPAPATPETTPTPADHTAQLDALHREALAAARANPIEGQKAIAPPPAPTQEAAPVQPSPIVAQPQGEPINATSQGQVEQGSVSQREGTGRQLQTEGVNRNVPPVQQAEGNQAGGSNQPQQGGAKPEEVATATPEQGGTAAATPAPVPPVTPEPVSVPSTPKPATEGNVEAKAPAPTSIPRPNRTIQSGSGKTTYDVPPDVTGTRNAQTETERAERNLLPVERQTYTKMGQAYLDGKAAVESGKIDPDGLARSVSDSPRPLTSTEVGALGHSRALLSRDYNATSAALDAANKAGDSGAQAELRARLTDLSSRLDVNDQALVKGGREQSAAFAARQMFVSDNGNLADVVKRAEQLKGNPLTDAERTRYEAQVNALNAKQAELDALNKRVEELQKPQTPPPAKTPRQATNAGAKEFGAGNKLFTKEMADAARARIEARSAGQGGTGTGGNTKTRGALDLGSLPDYVELAGHYIEGGIREFGALAARMREDAPKLTDGDMQTIWTNARKELNDRANKTVRPPSDLFVDKLSATMTRAAATQYVNDLNEAHPGALDKLLAGQKLTPEEQAGVTSLYQENAPKRTSTPSTGPTKTLQEMVADAKDVAAKAAKDKATAARTPEQVFRDDMATRVGNDRADAFVNGLPAAIKAKMLKGQALEVAEQMTVAKLYAKNRPPQSAPSTPSAAVAAVQASMDTARKAAFEAARPTREAQRAKDAAAKEAAKTDADRLRDSLTRSIGKDGADTFFKTAKPEDVKALIEGKTTPEQDQTLGKLVTSLRKPTATAAPVIKPVDDLRSAASDVRQQMQTQKQITALQAELDSGVQATKPPANKAEASQQLKDLQAQRDALTKAVGPQRAEPRRLADLDAKIADLNNQLKTGQFTGPQTRTPKVLSDAVMAKQEEVNRLQQQIKARIANEQPKTLSDHLLRWQRVALLSRVGTMGKLAAAAGARTALNPLEELFGGAISTALPGLADKAPVEGKFVPSAEVASLKKVFDKSTYQDALTKLNTGNNSLDTLYGKGEYGTGTKLTDAIKPEAGMKRDPSAFLDFFGNLHGAIKTPAQHAAFARAFEKISRSLPDGTDTTDPKVQMEIGTRAYLESNRAIFMQDNVASDLWNQWQGAASRLGEEGSGTRTTGKATAATMRFLAPIVKVPTNYVGEVGHYVGGLPEGVIRTMASKGFEKMTPDQADATMRAYKKGGVGAGLIALGLYGQKNGGIQLGGYYDKGKPTPGGLKPGEMKIGNIVIPHTFLHAPAIEALQWGATLGQSWKQTQGQWTDKLGHGLTTAAIGTAEQVPFVEQPVQAAKALESDKQFGTFAGKMVQSVAEPGLLQEAAQRFDKTKGGQPVQRAPRGFRETLKMGVPGLRQQVPVKTERGGGAKLPGMPSLPSLP